MANKINIKGLGKAQLLAALYNNAKLLIPSAAKPGIMTEEDAQKIIDERNNTKIDYVYGRIMKIDISGDEIDPWGYDRDNGEDTVAQIVKQLRDGKHIPPQEKKTQQTTS